VSDGEAEARPQPIWKKKPVVSLEVRKRQLQRRQQHKVKANTRISPIQARWLGELLRNGGNVSAAARAVGVTPESARRWLSLDAVSAAYQQAVLTVEGEVREWGQILGRAQATLVSLLDSEDDRVRMATAQYLIDRSLGKVAQKLDATVTRRDVLGEVELEAAVSLVALRGMSLSEATAYVRAHPQEVEAWAAQQLRDGRETERGAQHALPPIVSDGAAGS
jgi:hypothetical protein